ncbi:MAG: LuxR C-terminal-related transcriptional regulator [Chloroflexota bacterium]
MSTPLLATKFYFPVPRPNLVPRPRLLGQLEAGLSQDTRFSRKLTLVSAPAGYGKTTLVAAWLGGGVEGKARVALSSRVAWLSLEESDNDPARFLAYFIAALRGVEESLGGAVLSTLQSPQPPPFEIVLTMLVNDIAALAEPLILVLDDYHVISTPAIHQQLTFLLDHLPPHMHLVILTREDPLLPVARLRAREQVLEIRQDDLRFTAGETADFLERVMGLALAPEEIAALERRTEGWIAGLQLAALSMRGRQDLPGFIQAFTGSSRFILDYLIEEVYERQSSEIKDFLLKTSILERLSGPLCDALVEETGSQALLEGLEQANLFIVPLDQSRGWYRYHRLFAELLQHRLLASSSELVPELHQRASVWFEAEGLEVEAVRHALSARDWERAGSLIQRAGTEFLKRGEVLTVLGWFQSLPEEILLSNPQLCFNYCWPLLLAGQFDLAAPLLERLEQAAREIPAFLGEIYSAQAYLARGAGDHARMVERSRRALELLPESSTNSRGIVAMNLGMAYWHMGKMRAAEQVLMEALHAAQATGNHYAALTDLIFMGRVFAVRGQLYQALEYSQRAARQGGQMPVNALAYMDLAALYYEWNALDESDAHLQKAIAISQRSQDDEFLSGCWVLCVRLRIAQGDLAGASQALEHARALARAGKVPAPMVERMDVAQVLLMLAKGESVEGWSDRLSTQLDGHSFYRFLGVTKARTLPDVQARAYLESLGQIAQANEWGYGLIAIRALQAAVAEKQESALAYLTEALHLAEGSGFVRVFVEAGEKLVPLLRQVAARRGMPDYVRRILAVMVGETGGKPASLASLVEPLSERELEVLRLVTSGMSNREIAEQLVITTGTAKSHVHNLCGKLGVRNRTEAAMRAKELGLL